MVEPPKGIEETQACCGLAARKRARELTRQYEKALRPYNLKATQFGVLAALAQTGPVPHSRLANILGLERTTLTRVVGIMEARDIVRTEERVEDERVRIIDITSAGMNLLNEAFPAWKQVQNDVTEQSTKDFIAK